MNEINKIADLFKNAEYQLAYPLCKGLNLNLCEVFIWMWDNDYIIQPDSGNYGRINPELNVGDDIHDLPRIWKTDYEWRIEKELGIDTEKFKNKQEAFTRFTELFIKIKYDE